MTTYMLGLGTIPALFLIYFLLVLIARTVKAGLRRLGVEIAIGPVNSTEKNLPYFQRRFRRRGWIFFGSTHNVNVGTSRFVGVAVRQRGFTLQRRVLVS